MIVDLEEGHLPGQIKPVKSVALMQKNNPLLLFIAWVRKIEEIPHSIPDNMLTELILVGLDGHMPKNHKNQREKEFMVAKNTSGTVAVSGTNVSNL